MAQNINYDAAIGSDGTLNTNLTIVRAHNGNQSPYWWYQTTNQDYLQIFVPNGSTLENQSGGISKNIPAPINYTRNGYSTDPLVAAIASTTQQNFSYPKVTAHTESGKAGVRRVVAHVRRPVIHGLIELFAPTVRDTRRRRAIPICLRAPERRDGELSHRGGRAARLRVRRERTCELYVQLHQHAGAIDVHTDVAEDIGARAVIKKSLKTF